LLLLLPLAAFLLREKSPDTERGVSPPKFLLHGLDTLAIALLLVAIYNTGAGVFRLAVFGHTIISSSEASRSLFFLVLVLVVRCALAYPRFLSTRGGSLLMTLRNSRSGDAFWLGTLWVLLGFFGSFGLKFFFHRALYEMWPVFRSIRVPARWAMICYLG